MTPPVVQKSLIPERRRIVTPPQPMSMTIEMEPAAAKLADARGFWFQGQKRRRWQLVCCDGMETIVLGDSMLK